MTSKTKTKKKKKNYKKKKEEKKDDLKETILSTESYGFQKKRKYLLFLNP